MFQSVAQWSYMLMLQDNFRRYRELQKECNHVKRYIYIKYSIVFYILYSIYRQYSQIWLVGRIEVRSCHIESKKLVYIAKAPSGCQGFLLWGWGLLSSWLFLVEKVGSEHHSDHTGQHKDDPEDHSQHLDADQGPAPLPAPLHAA